MVSFNVVHRSVRKQKWYHLTLFIVQLGKTLFIDQLGNRSGIMKRCSSFVRKQKWYHLTFFIAQLGKSNGII